MLKNYTAVIATLTLVPSGQGRFEVTVGDELIFSKKALGRHAEAGEVTRHFGETTGATPQPRE
ncbi:MAG: Rdx family protein [Caldilineaceae bacterium]|nr:Rdx family protein [Caldilineaceae bacterium]